MTAVDLARGWAICHCGKFAHILSSEALRQLPAGYAGELCPDCNLWMAAVDKLPREEWPK